MSDPDTTFELDLTGLQPPADAETVESNAKESALTAILENYGDSSQTKALKLVRGCGVALVKDVPGIPEFSHTVRVYSVTGSRPYVVTLRLGDDFTFVECSCPNGSHRGGDAQCYHGIAAQIESAGLGDWIRESRGV